MPGIVYPVRLTSIATYLLQSHGRGRSLTATEIGILRDTADLIVEEIQDQWPVDTGTSRDAWEYDLHVHYPDIGFDLVNEMDYAPYVSRAGDGGGPLFETLVPEVVMRHADALRVELMTAINAAEVKRRQQEERRGRGAPATLWGRR